MPKASICIGIIGGCLSAQLGIPFSALYHRRLKKLLLEQEIDANIRFAHLGRDLDVLKWAGNLVQQRVDVLLYHSRPQPFLNQSKLVIQTVEDDSRRAYKLNPILLQIPCNRENALFSLPVRSLKPRSKDSLLGMLNLLSGILMRLANRALGKELATIFAIARLCKDARIHFIAMGPPVNRLSFLSKFACWRLSTMLSSELKLKAIPFINLFSATANHPDLFLSTDNLHLNKTGHGLVAEMVFKELQLYLQATNVSEVHCCNERPDDAISLTSCEAPAME